MHRRQLLVALFSAGPLVLLAKDKGHGKGKGHGKKHGEEDEGSGYYRREDYVVVQRYYAGPRDLPPGLRKKYYKSGKLPPGWEKKMRPFPVELVQVLPPPPPYCERGYIDGVAVIYDRRTRIILDSIDIISAIAGH